MQTITYIIKSTRHITAPDGTVTTEDYRGCKASMPYSEANLAIAQSEAWPGTLEIVDDGQGVDAEALVAEMSAACNASIVSGVDVTLEDGSTDHYSLTLEDQVNILTLKYMVDAGATEVSFHADGGRCRFYSAADFQRIATAATAWKSYQESYFNSLRDYIRALDTQEALGAVTYGMEIPEEYQTEPLKKLLAGGGGT